MSESPKMATFVFITSTLTLSLLFTLSSPQQQQPNTDGFSLSLFFHNWGKNSNHLTNICSFPGITCDSQMGNIISLVASGLNLSGPIPENTIAKLTKLQSLDLSNNNINRFSADFWDLGSSLVSLNLSGNQIDGSLSNNIGNFGRLERLDLSNNRFSGEIPAAIGSLSSLELLSLSSNGFEGEIPDGIVGCKSLVWMDLSVNKLNGSLFDCFGAGFKNLRVLNLAGNGFDGSMPNFSASSFQGSSNQFHGSLFKVNISFNWSSSSLIYLDLSGNQLSIDFLSNLSRAQSLNHVEYLNLSRTGLVGQIPTEVSKLSSLATLDLSHNQLTDRILDFDTKNLRVLDLSSNNLTGEIPVSLQHQLLNLERFNFSYNNLTLCIEQLPPRILNSSLIGSTTNCPIAANPGIVQTKRIKYKGLKLALAIILTSFFLITAVFCIVFGFRKRTRSWAVRQLSHSEEPNISIPVIIFEKPLMNLTFSDLLTMTSNFDKSTLLLEGRFGAVYRGVFPEAIQVAMKVLVCGTNLTEHEVSRELERLGRIKHPNLVPLLGYCLAGDQQIAIYEYMENGNLQNLLHEDNDEGKSRWMFRYKIALGIARAMAFLHHGCIPQIVHGDVKASSVYFDSNFEPKLSDFGLDNVVGNGFDSGAAALTAKSDVYGFGVILFELITGRKPIFDRDLEEEDRSLVSWARKSVKKNQGLLAIDPKITSAGYSEEQMEEALRIAYLCTADLPSKRPSMQQIVGLLKDLEPIVCDQREA